MRAKFSTCFIAAPISVDTSRLRAALEMRKVRWIDAAAAAPTGASVITTIESAIRQANFVCAVLSDNSESPWVLFELGLAKGLRRPILIFAEPGTKMPAELQDINYARVSLDDPGAIEFHLDAFLKNSPRHPARPKPHRHRQAQTDISWLEEKLTSLPTDQASQRAFQFEAIVAQLFEQAGAVVSTNQAPDTGADMVVWLDQLQASLPNPLVVEARIGHLTPQKLSQSEEQIRRYANAVHGGAGFLIYYDFDGRDFGPAERQWPLVFRYSVRQFAALVARGELVREVLGRRNRLTHWGPA